MQMLWKDIIGFENYYQISNLGEIRSLDRYIGKRFHKGQLIKLHIGNHGYLQVNLKKNSLSNTKLVHRLVALHFIDNLENKPEVNHIDGNKLNCREDNLEWNTISENSLHAYKLGLKKSYLKPKNGSENINAKLTIELVREIREKYKNNNISQRMLAKEYNVSQVTINNIVNNTMWIE